MEYRGSRLRGRSLSDDAVYARVLGDFGNAEVSASEASVARI
jgi:hypothetical protein